MDIFHWNSVHIFIKTPHCALYIKTMFRQLGLFFVTRLRAAELKDCFMTYCRRGQQLTFLSKLHTVHYISRQSSDNWDCFSWRGWELSWKTVLWHTVGGAAINMSVRMAIKTELIFMKWAKFQGNKKYIFTIGHSLTGAHMPQQSITFNWREKMYQT